MAPNSIAVPTGDLEELAELLTGTGEFLRSGSAATSALTGILASSGHAHPGFAASNLTGHVSFTAYWLRGLTGRAGPAAQDRPAGSPASGHRWPPHGRSATR